jgi:galactokinase
MRGFDAQLCAAGMSAEASTAKAGRLEELAGELKELRGGVGAPAYYALFAPGRVEFLGKHTDYAGGRSITCAIERGICMVAALREDAQVRIVDTRRASTAAFALDAALEPARGHWSNFPMTVARRIARDFPGARRGADIAFASDLPRASGMSSSSTFVVAVFFGLAQANALWQRDDYKEAIRSREDLAGYIAAIESGAGFGGFSGSSGVGTHGGSEDHVAILCSRAGCLQQYSYCPVRFEREVRLPDDLVFAIAVSGVKADKTGDARDAYNRASGATRRILELWRKATGREDTSVAALLGADGGAAEKIRGVLRESHDTEYPAALLADRFEQFVQESEQIVPAAAEALERNDNERLREAVDRSQSLAEKLLGNQVPETVELARSARQLGAVAASAFGAGFGGSVWALVRPESAEEFRAEWATQYHRRFPERAEVSEFFLSRPGPGLIEME